jgi:hypothetical protein
VANKLLRLTAVAEKHLDYLIEDLKRRRDAIDGQLNDLKRKNATTEVIDKLHELRGRAEITSRSSGQDDDETQRIPRSRQ